MGTQKKTMVQKERKGHGPAAATSSSISDGRFAKIETDPRFRLPSRKKTAMKVDKRFKDIFKDNEITGAAQVDRYGRKLETDKKKKALEKLYNIEIEDSDDDHDEDDEEDSEDDGKDRKKAGKRGAELDKEVERELARVEKKYDPARQGGFSESDSDDDSDDSDDSSDNDSDEVGGGTNSSKKVDTQGDAQEEEQIPTGEVTHRLAVVNLDWDKITSTDLMVLFSSFIPKESSGRIESVTIYPTRYGKEQMRREELEGPPKEFFKSKKDKKAEDGSDDGNDSDESNKSEDEDEEEEEEDDDDDDDDDSFDSEDESSGRAHKELNREEDDANIDPEALRAYQISRLRYYYAVIVCSDKATSHALYESTDGTEYQASSNFIDLRFLQNDVVFDDDDEPRDECTEVPKNYEPLDFSTDALQHSKVKLTWDTRPDDARRKDVINKAFTSTPDELLEMQDELMAFVASASESEDDDDDDDDVGEDEEIDSAKGKNSKKSKKEMKRRKMRSIFGFDEDGDGNVWDDKKARKKNANNLQITFTPALEVGLKQKKSKVTATGEPIEETAIEKYKRQERERKEKRRQRAIAKREGRDLDDEEGGDKGGGGAAGAGADSASKPTNADLGFDDPFFADDPSEAKPQGKRKILKEERLKKRAAREAEEKAHAEELANLEKLMQADDARSSNKIQHVDFRELKSAEKARIKQEKRDKKKGKKSKSKGDEEQEETGNGVFDVDALDDPRFQQILKEPDLAIDQTNPEYEDLLSTRKITKELQRKRKAQQEEDGEIDRPGKLKVSKKAKRRAGL